MLICIALSSSVAMAKEPVNQTKDEGISKKDVQELKDSQREIKNTQKAILEKLSDMEKKLAGQGKPGIDYNKVFDLPVAHSPVKGNKKARVTIMEFSDFQCPYCSQLQTTIEDVLKAYPNDVKLVFKHYPLSFHQQAMNAAKAAEAAGAQGKFWEMHDLLFQNYNKLTDESYKEFAQQLGLNMDKFSAHFAGGASDKQIKEDVALANKAAVTGTPTLFINGKRMQHRSLEDFKKTIDSILKK